MNSKIEGGETPLMIAASKGNSDFLSFLIENQAKVDEIDKEGYTSLLHSFSSNPLNNVIVETLING